MVLLPWSWFVFHSVPFGAVEVLFLCVGWCWVVEVVWGPLWPPVNVLTKHKNSGLFLGAYTDDAGRSRFFFSTPLPVQGLSDRLGASCSALRPDEFFDDEGQKNRSPTNEKGPRRVPEVECSSVLHEGRSWVALQHCPLSSFTNRSELFPNSSLNDLMDDGGEGHVSPLGFIHQ